MGFHRLDLECEELKDVGRPAAGTSLGTHAGMLHRCHGQDWDFQGSISMQRRCSIQETVLPVDRRPTPCKSLLTTLLTSRGTYVV